MPYKWKKWRKILKQKHFLKNIYTLQVKYKCYKTILIIKKNVKKIWKNNYKIIILIMLR